MNQSEIIFFSSFLVFVVFVLTLDLGVFNRKSHIISFKEALIWSIVWISIGLSFTYIVHSHGDWIHGIKSIADIQLRIDKYHHLINISGLSYEDALAVYKNNLSVEYVTGYLIEKALSVDNLFVMIMIFFAFNVKKIYYKRVLMWGIIGAVVMRFIFIFGSAAIISKFSWFLYFFGALLVYTGIKMFIHRNEEEKKMDVSQHPIVKFMSKYFRVFPKYVGKNFFIKKKSGKVYFTPLFIVLLVVEFSDVIFATDSVPAIFSISQDPYIVFFSNIFAIMGLRSLFFLILNVINLFHYLKHGLSILLTFIGFKLLFNEWLKEIGFTTAMSLYVVLGILVISILLSIIFPKKVNPANELVP